MGKGLMDFLQNEAAEIVCFQELKANETQIDQQAISEAGYAFQYYFSAQKKGYSGVGILCKTKPKNVIFGCGHELFDLEGGLLGQILTIFRSSAFIFRRGQAATNARK